MQPQIDQMTGMPIRDPQQQLQQAPANMQSERPQNFISPSQQKMGQQVFGDQSLPTPMYKMDPTHNGEPGVQKEDFEQF
jgi:hypothetical protein